MVLSCSSYVAVMSIYVAMHLYTQAVHIQQVKAQIRLELSKNINSNFLNFLDIIIQTVTKLLICHRNIVTCYFALPFTRSHEISTKSTDF